MACQPERCGAEPDREPRLFMAMPGADTLCHPAKFSSRRLTSLPLSFPALLLLLLTSSRLHLLRWNQLLLLPFFFFLRHLVPGRLKAAPAGRCHRSPESARKRETTTCGDNPRLKRTLTENCLFFKVCKYFSITRRHFLSL